MTGTKEFIDRLNRAPVTPGAMTAIRDFLLMNFADIPFLTSGEIAERAEVSKASITRFVHLMSFTSFAELKDAVKTMLYSSKFSPAAKYHILERSDDVPDLMGRIVQSEQDAVAATVSSIDPQAIVKAAEALIKSRVVAVYGERFSFGLAFIFGLHLRQFLPNVRIITGLGGTEPDELSELTRDCHLFVIAHKRVGAKKTAMTAYCRSKGIPFSVLTDLDENEHHAVLDGALVVFRSKTESIRSFRAYSASYITLTLLANTVELLATSAGTRLTATEAALQQLHAFAREEGNSV